MTAVIKFDISDAEAKIAALKDRLLELQGLADRFRATLVDGAIDVIRPKVESIILRPRRHLNTAERIRLNREVADAASSLGISVLIVDECFELLGENVDDGATRSKD